MTILRRLILVIICCIYPGFAFTQGVRPERPLIEYRGGPGFNDTKFIEALRLGFPIIEERDLYLREFPEVSVWPKTSKSEELNFFLTVVYDVSKTPRNAFLTDLIDGTISNQPPPKKRINGIFQPGGYDTKIWRCAHWGAKVDILWTQPESLFNIRAGLLSHEVFQKGVGDAPGPPPTRMPARRIVPRIVGTGEIRSLGSEQWLVLRTTRGKVMGIMLLTSEMPDGVWMSNMQFRGKALESDKILQETLHRFFSLVGGSELFFPMGVAKGTVTKGSQN